MSHRTQITLTDEQYDLLRRESSRSGLALAELIRRAVHTAYGGPRAEEAHRALQTSFGVWRDREFDGETYVDRLRQGLGQRLEQ